MSLGSGSFGNATAEAGVTTGSAALLRFIRRGRSFSGREPHCFFLNTGSGRFADVSAAANLNLPDDGRAVGIVDWDRDGDLDLWITNRNGPQLRFLRNSMPRHHRFLSLKLEGRHCNRDAIGARVELDLGSNNTPRVKTLRAGDGYLAQSSKWLHFGLKNHASHVVATVHWPDGSHDRFENLQADSHYRLIQSRDVAQKIELKATDLANLPIPQPATPRKADSRVLTISGMPVPRFRYETFDGQRRDVVNFQSNKPTLLILFASWCPACVQELTDLAKHASQIEDANLEVVALSIDHLDKTDGATTDQIQAMVKKTGYAFAAGLASEETVVKFQLINDHLFDLHLPVPVPTSLLIDGKGSLVAMYKGPVAVETLFQDLATSTKPIPERRSSSTPFAGRWHEPINRTSHVPLLDGLIQNGLLSEADDLVRRLGNARKQLLLPAIVRLGIEMYRKGNRATAAEHFKVVVRMDKTFVGVETALARERLRENRPDSTIKLYREALRRSPTNLSSLNGLAWILATHPNSDLRNGGEAIELAKKAVALTNSKDPSTLDTLAAAYAEKGNFNSALESANRALELARERGRIELATRIEARISGYKNQTPARQ